MVSLDRYEVQRFPFHIYFHFKFHFIIDFFRKWSPSKVHFCPVLLSGEGSSAEQLSPEQLLSGVSIRTRWLWRPGRQSEAPPSLWRRSFPKRTVLVKFCCPQRCAFSIEEPAFLFLPCHTDTQCPLRSAVKTSKQVSHNFFFQIRQKAHALWLPLQQEKRG
jgi:hypothetical protein